MRDDVRVHVLREMKTNCHAARAGIGVAVGNIRNAGRVGESHCDRNGIAMQVGRAGKRRAALRRRKRSGDEDSLRVRRSITWMGSIEVVQSLEDFLGDGHVRIGASWRHALEL